MKTNKEMYPDYDWDKIPSGSTFKAYIQGSLCEGRIFKEDDSIYLCQDVKEGVSCSNKLGFKYSWVIYGGNPLDLKHTSVKNLEVWLPEKGYKIPMNKDINSFGIYSVRITKDVCKVGCTLVSFEQVKAVYNKMLKLRKSEK